MKWHEKHLYGKYGLTGVSISVKKNKNVDYLLSFSYTIWTYGDENILQ